MGRISNVLVGSTRGPNLEVQDRRGVEIIDTYGDLVFISDEQIPRVIALLARHLGGEEVAMAGQENVSDISDSETLAEALDEVEQHLRRLQERRDDLAAKQRQMAEHTLRVDDQPCQVELVSISEVFDGWAARPGGSNNGVTQ